MLNPNAPAVQASCGGRWCSRTWPASSPRRWAGVQLRVPMAHMAMPLLHSRSAGVSGRPALGLSVKRSCRCISMYVVPHRGCAPAGAGPAAREPGGGPVRGARRQGHGAGAAHGQYRHCDCTGALRQQGRVTRPGERSARAPVEVARMPSGTPWCSGASVTPQQGVQLSSDATQPVQVAPASGCTATCAPPLQVICDGINPALIRC